MKMYRSKVSDSYRVGDINAKPKHNIGSNNAGKKYSLESIMTPLILSHTNTIEVYKFLHIYEAACGSLLHAFCSLANKEAKHTFI